MIKGSTVSKYDLTGKKFGHLLVLKRAANNRLNKTGQHAKYLCQCSCGRKLVIFAQSLRASDTKSCGCRRGLIHGHYKNGKPSPTYISWQAMIGRCEIEGTNGYERYGGRGISVCNRWRTFANFLADMGERPIGKTLDRINGDGNYQPNNCRWASAVEQRKNQ